MDLLCTIADSDRYLWCPCFVEASGRLWMFASAWPKAEGFDGWREHSRIVVIELDPTTYANIGSFRTIEPLGPDRALYSPRVVCQDNAAFLAFSESLPGSRYKVGGARLSLGRWNVLRTRSDLFADIKDTWDQALSQGPTFPTPYLMPDGTYGMVFRMDDKAKRATHLYHAAAPEGLGPWSVPQRIEIDENDNLDDPSIWYDGNKYTLLMRDIGGTITGVGWPAIGQLQSNDGKNWGPTEHGHMFNRTLPDASDIPTLFHRTEQPSVFNQGQTTLIGFAVTSSPEAVSYIRLYRWKAGQPYLERPADPHKTEPEIEARIAAVPSRKTILPDLPLVDRIQAHHLTYLRPARLKSLEAEMDSLPDGSQPGLVVEFGVALGGSGALLASKLPRGMAFVGYDVFGQIPSPDENDSARSHERYAIIDAGESKGLHGETYYGYRDNLIDEVKANFAVIGAPVDGKRIKLVKGLFRDTVNFPEGTVIRLAHIDCDWYDPTMFCLDAVAPYIPKWGTIIIDDFDDWEGCRRATHEWLAANPDFRLREVQPHAIIRRFEIT